MHGWFAWFGLPGTFVLTMLLSALAVLLAVCFPSKPRWICAAAMVFSSLGDIMLMDFRHISRYLPIPAFYVGAVLFMVAHVLYLAAFALRIRRARKPLVNWGLIAALVIVVVAGASLLWPALHRPRIPWLMVGVCTLYLLIIGANFCTIWSYTASRGRWRYLAAAGALAFLFSDWIIGLGSLANVYRPDLNRLIWWCYPIGQGLILLFGEGYRRKK